MALNENQKAKVELFKTELEKVGESLIRYKVFKEIDSSFGSTYWNTLKKSSTTPEDIQGIIKEDRDSYVSKDVDMIDPETVYNILSGIMWPSISSVDVAMVDHPDNAQLSAMRGVTMRVVYKDNKIDTSNWNSAFDTGQKSPLDHAVFGSYQQAYDNMISVIKSTLNPADQKELLSLVFNSEVAAKCWWINIYGRQPALGSPIKLIASLNAYLGYFTMIIGWLQGTGALASRNITTAISSELKTLPIINLGPLSFDNTQNSLDVKSVSATVKAIQKNYEWLQKQKNNENKKYYEGWFDRFFNIPKSIVNMLIIINERVHLNINKEFTYSPKASARLTAMGSAYATKFELTLNA